MERALRYFAIAFFFTFPAIFFPPDWRSDFIWSASFPFLESFTVSRYEGMKISCLALFGAVFSLGTPVSKYREMGFPRISSRFLLPFSVFALFWWSSWSNPGFPFSDAVAWKTYSVLPFLSLFAIGLSLSAYDSDFRKNSTLALVCGFVVANLPYAVFQTLWYDPFSASAILPWESGRAFWTMGNPNSLAFFAAASLPLAFAFLKKGVRRKLAVASLLGIVAMSGSWSGMTVAAAYLSYRYLGFARTAFLWIAATVAFAVVSSVAEPSWSIWEKRLSLSTRAAIIWDSSARAVSNPRTFLSGDGARAVETSLSRKRSEELANRVDPSVPIDRAHFFLLDVALVFWTPFALALLAFAFNLAQKTERPSREALSVLFLLSCLHTPTSAHLLFAVLLLVSGLRAPKKPAISAWTA